MDRLSAQDVPVWQLVEEVQVGADYDFTRILAVIPFRDGSSIVADNGNQDIAFFDARGRYVHRIGSNGRGPGEFVRLRSVGMLGDTLWVIDGGEQRTSLFSREGNVLGTIRTEPGAFLTAVLSNGAAVGMTSSGFGSGTELRDTVLPILLTSRAGRTADTLAFVPSRNDNLVLARSDGGFSIAKQRFSDAGLVLVSPTSDGFFVIDRSVASRRDDAFFTVAALDADGDTVWYRGYPYAPDPVEKTVVDSFFTAIEAPFLRAGHTRAEIRRALFVPEFYPPITSGVAAADGSLWLRREEASDSTRYLVIARSGRPVATVGVRTTVTLMAASDSMVWGVRRDEFDVPSVVRYRIRR